MQVYSTIRIKKETQAKLKLLGDMGDSYDDVINKLIQDIERRIDKIDDDDMKGCDIE